MKKTRQSTPIVQTPIVDRLAFILMWGCDPYDDQEELLKVIRRRVRKAIEAGRCEPAFPNGSRYRENFRILLDGGHSALVQIGALIPARQNGGIRVVLNPARLQAGDATQFNRVLRKIVGPEYDQLIRRPLINCVDFAVDIHYVVLSRVLVRYNNAQRHSMFCKRVNGHGQIEGYNFGSERSDYMMAVYDKRVERVHAAIVSLIKKARREGRDQDALKQNVLKQIKLIDGTEVLRVEVRGKKLRGKPLHELPDMPNRFERFQFADLGQAGGPALSRLTERAFIAMCRQDGAKAAIAAFKKTKQARKVNAFWRARQADWWQPEPMWQQACAALRATGIFPAEAFTGSAVEHLEVAMAVQAKSERKPR